MATNIDVTLKRFNGTDYDLILPTTHLGQLWTDNTLTTTLSSYMDSRFARSNTIGVADGLATLGDDGKLTRTQIPEFLLAGGLKFDSVIDAAALGTVGAYGNADIRLSIYNIVPTTLSNFWTTATDEELENHQGTYWIFESGGFQGDTTIMLYKGAEDTDGVIVKDPDRADIIVNLGAFNTSQTIYVHSGDWLVFEGRENGVYKFSTVTNTTDHAGNQGNYGVVRLKNSGANFAAYDAQTNDSGLVPGSADVITEGVLSSNILRGELNSGASGANQDAQKIAGSDHIHDGRYYTETEIGTFFANDVANGGLTGYNKANWDTAYGWGNHGSVGYLTEESLEDLTDVALSEDELTGRVLAYDGTNWVDNATFKPILYGDEFDVAGTHPATITGTLCIETA